MRGFSSVPHIAFIANRQDGRVQPVNRAPTRPIRADVLILIGGILLGAALFFAVAILIAAPRFTMLGQEPAASATLAPTPSASPTATARLPDADVTGEDLLALPRYPGSVRSDYEVVLDERYRLTVTEYLAVADIGEVRAFYHGVIAAHGWERADIGFSDGEWSYALVDGSTLALIEIEEAGGLIEIDLQISEALVVATPTPAAFATAAPLPPPPPPPLPPGDDDDDDDDDD